MHDISLNRETFRYLLTLFRYVISEHGDHFSDLLPFFFHAHETGEGLAYDAKKLAFLNIFSSESYFAVCLRGK